MIRTIFAVLGFTHVCQIRLRSLALKTIRLITSPDMLGIRMELCDGSC
jgi:hypothetical protein